MIESTLKEITSHNAALTNALTQQESFKREIADEKTKRNEQVNTRRHQLQLVEDGIKKLEEELSEL